METVKLEWLENLYQLTMDGIMVFQEAIDRLGHERIRLKLIEYNQVHKEQALALWNLMGRRDLNGPTSENGIADEVLSLLRTATGDSDTLKALRQFEGVLRENYLEALGELGGDMVLSKLLNHNLYQESGHLAYIREALAHPEAFGPSETWHP